jgi:hypothetical protein
LKQFVHCLKSLSMPSVENGNYLVRFRVNAVDKIMDGRRVGEDITFDFQSFCSCNNLRASEFPSKLKALHHGDVYGNGLEHLVELQSQCPTGWGGEIKKFVSN